MSNGPAIAPLPRAPVIDLFPTLEPHLVEVIIPFSTGTVDEAVRQATAVIQSAVQNAINNLVGNAPSVLDTIKELDDAIGNDPNYATTVATALSTKLVKSANLSDLLSLADALRNLGLDKVNNTADADKPVSKAQQAALDKKLTNVQSEFSSVFGDLFFAWFQSLPTTAPALSNKWWNNGNTLALTF